MHIGGLSHPVFGFCSNSPGWWRHYIKCTAVFQASHCWADVNCSVYWASKKYKNYIPYSKYHTKKFFFHWALWKALPLRVSSPWLLKRVVGRLGEQQSPHCHYAYPWGPLLFSATSLLFLCFQLGYNGLRGAAASEKNYTVHSLLSREEWYLFWMMSVKW